MPEKTSENSFKWWAAVLSAGPGWVIPGALKQMGGAILVVFIFAEAGAADYDVMEGVPGMLEEVQMKPPSPMAPSS